MLSVCLMSVVENCLSKSCDCLHDILPLETAHIIMICMFAVVYLFCLSVLVSCGSYKPFFIMIKRRDVGLETWSWFRDRSRPLFEVLVLVLVSEGGLEQDLRLCAC